jgi:crotonobetainyl-CoA:carnitine CoA-transferase CaiB-like acyl-CoA transferase
MADRDAEGALSDLRVLDLAGPIGVYCGKLLAGLGADVVKVEPPGGDPMRDLGPFYPYPSGEADPDQAPTKGERSLYWWHYNINKRGITLGLESAAGQDLFKRLAGVADIVVESFAPGYLDGLGLGWEVLHELNPSLIVTSITPFGQTGPYAEYKATDVVGQATSGVMNQVGMPGKPPYTIGMEMGYWTAATLAADGTMLALTSRDAGGQGQHVDTSMQQAMTLGTGSMLAYYEVEGRIVRRGRFGLGGGTPLRDSYPSKDGWVFFLAASVGTSMDAVADFVAEHGMGDEFDPAWRDLESMRRDPDQLAKFQSLMYRFFSRYTGRELLEMGIAHSPPVFVVPNDHADAIVSSPQLADRGFFIEVEHPELGKTITYPGAPYLMPESPWKLTRRAPLVGEHNLEVYSEWLGMDRSEVERLERDGVI